MPIWCSDFITRMDYAYAAADLIISRAGASSISELCLLKKPVILVPSPNVAEDHQTKRSAAMRLACAAICGLGSGSGLGKVAAQQTGG